MTDVPVASGAALHLIAPAKINLHLRVGKAGHDGFHPLVSWMTRISLADQLTLSLSGSPRPANSGQPVDRSANGPALVLDCDDPALPLDERNLVVKAAALLRRLIDADRLPATQRNTQARLHKRVPAGAGLGGGSSDGATALLGLNRLWDVGLDRSALSRLAEQLGSDVPFFLYGPSSVCRGRGQIVAPIDVPLARWAVLILPRVHMPTPAVYRRFDEMNLGTSLDLVEDGSAWTTLSAESLLERLVNDLEAPAFAISPALAELRSAAEHEVARPVRMSGSGSTLFTLFDDEARATDAANRLSTALKTRCLAVQTGWTPPDASNALISRA